MDVQLADRETGPDVARHLTGTGIPVLFMTANANVLPEDLAGALGVSPKPVAQHILKRAVDHAAARSSGEQFGAPPEGLIVGKQSAVSRQSTASAKSLRGLCRIASNEVFRFRGAVLTIR